MSDVLDMPKTQPCNCGKKPRREFVQIGFCDDQGYWRFYCMHCKIIVGDRETSYQTEKEVVQAWNAR